MKKGWRDLATSKGRLPPRRDIALVFAWCVFTVHVWSIINLLKYVPAWRLKLSLWDLIGVVAYTQAFALLESALLLSVLLLLAAVLPARLFRDRFTPIGSMLVLLTSVWAAAVHQAIRLWGLERFGLWTLLYLASLAIFGALMQRSKRIDGFLTAFAERAMVLSSIYVAMDLLGVVVLILRNIQGRV